MDRLNVGHDLAAFCVRCVLVTQEEHEWLAQAHLNNAAKRPAVDVNASLAS